MKLKDNKRAKEFLECLGRGKTIYECESENDMIDKIWEEELTKKIGGKK